MTPAAPPQVFRVAECSDCPLRTDAWGCRASAHRTIVDEGWAPGVAPAWCPLRLGPTVVVLAEDAERGERT